MESSMSPEVQKTFENTWLMKRTNSSKKCFRQRQVRNTLMLLNPSWLAYQNLEPLFVAFRLIDERGNWKRSCLKYLKDLKDGKVKKGSHSYMFMIELYNTTTADSWVLDTGKSSRVSKPFQFYYGFHIDEDKISDSILNELDEPANYKEAMANPKAPKWKEAMKSKI
ncbi:hypothetical protein Tco_0947350 [Tanacetum coccineum]